MLDHTTIEIAHGHPAAVQDIGTARLTLCAGTTVMTLAGAVAVEDLKAGDRIVARNSGTAILRTVTTSMANTATIRIKAGSLGHTRPDQDMIVCADAIIHVRDWRAKAIFAAPAAKVSAGLLIDGEFVADAGTQSQALWTLSFDRADIIYVDGLEICATTFLNQL